MKLILIRHTLSKWNEAGRLTGHKDIGLSSQGKLDAVPLAKELLKLNIDFIVSSNLLRARETAEIINEVLKVPIELEPLLR